MMIDNIQLYAGGVILQYERRHIAATSGGRLAWLEAIIKLVI